MKLPYGWHVMTLEGICSGDLQTGPFGSQLHANEYVAEGVVVVMPKDIVGGRIVASTAARISPERAHQLRRHKLKEGDVIFSRRGDVARAGLVSEADQGILCGTGCLRARPNQDHIFPPFLNLLVQSPQSKRWLENNAVGQTMPNMNTEILSQLTFKLPPLHEQERISAITSTWDGAIAKTEQLIAAKERHYSHEVSRMISRAQHPLTHVGAFAEEVSARNRGGNEARVLSVTNSRGFVLPEDQFERRVASADLSNYKVVRRGQYAYNPSRINVGSIARLDGWDDGVLSPMYVVFRLDEDKAASDYFLHWLKSHEARQRIKNSAQGSVRDTVSFSEFAAISIPLPDSNTQTAIARCLNALREEIDLLGRSVSALKTQKHGLMQKLLTGQWRLLNTQEAKG